MPVRIADLRWPLVLFAVGLIAGYIFVRATQIVSDPTPSQSIAIRPELEYTPVNSTQSSAPVSSQLKAVADLYETAADVSSDELAAMIGTTLVQIDMPRRLDEMTVLYRRYAELDPQAALNHAFSQGAGYDQCPRTVLPFAIDRRFGAESALS